MVGHRPDAGFGKVALGAQRALGFGDRTGREPIAFGNQQLPGEDPGARVAVQEIRPAEEPLALARFVEVEDVADMNRDLPDAGALGFELRRWGRRLLQRCAG